MKALVYTGEREMRYRDEPEPAPLQGEVLLRVDAAGICGSDMHAWHGHDPRRVPPLILGHELVGTILDGARAGHRVTVNPLITCGRCDYCVQGRQNLCSARGMIGMTRPGAFAERVAVASSSLIDIPQDMGEREAALTEPAATALHALNLCQRALTRPLAEARVRVIGGGAVGLLAALLARAWGCVDVSLAETNPLRRAAAARTGLRVVDPREQPPDEAAFELVIDAVGSRHTRAVALQAVCPGGVFMHVGLQDWASEIDMRRITLAEITLLGTYTYTTADMRATVRALHAGVFGDLEWVEERSLRDGAQAFAELDQGSSPAAKILLRP
ncbi:MAG: alcohol dehydrogenase catalytic domain-containing protein [Betaproteobacteria bacterium]|nr:alcohol dehydrogenase catalytic domain-containing protein [Betaproteobacteria bacterium]